MTCGMVFILSLIHILNINLKILTFIFDPSENDTLISLTASDTSNVFINLPRVKVYILVKVRFSHLDVFELVVLKWSYPSIVSMAL